MKLVQAGIPSFPGRKTMLLTFGVLLSLAACAVIARMRIPGRLDAADLGWMSQQWLAEYRASHSAQRIGAP